jgi:hypothetical protein
VDGLDGIPAICGPVLLERAGGGERMPPGRSGSVGEGCGFLPGADWFFWSAAAAIGALGLKASSDG